MVPLRLRAIEGSGVCATGAIEESVMDITHVFDLLQRGTLARKQSATAMNARSSRSHAIFTLTLEQDKSLAMVGSGDEAG